MYICLCNNLNSKKVNYAIERGVSSSKKIYSFYNCKPKCGKCIDLMNCIVEKEGDKIKTIRFGQKGAKTAGKPKAGESAKMKAKRKSFKARHAKNIKKGKMSAAYWADRVKW